MDNINKDFGLFIKNKRLEAGLSQAEVAKMLGVSQVSYGRYELGTRDPGLPNVIALGKILGFMPGDFFDNYR